MLSVMLCKEEFIEKFGGHWVIAKHNDSWRIAEFKPYVASSVAFHPNGYITGMWFSLLGPDSHLATQLTFHKDRVYKNVIDATLALPEVIQVDITEKEVEIMHLKCRLAVAERVAESAKEA